MSEKNFDVAVIGCGLMGAAMARAFARSGHRVAAWNRTPERAQALTADGITAVSSAADAVGQSRLVVACTATYETTKEALRGVADWDGTPLVNVASGAPDDVLALDAWASERGIAYLDGAIICFPRQIGTDEGIVLYSGSAEVWEAHASTLKALGEMSDLVGTEVHAASVVDAAIVGAFYVSAVTAYLEGATFAMGLGISADTLRGITQLAGASVQVAIAEAIEAIDSGEYATNQATLSVYAEGCRAVVEGMRASGHRARLLGAALEGLEAAEAAGLGDLGIYAAAQVTSS
jgi:3-hydroxyisobutyrate dehydrogenase-like beta-hydroxyacid dehydrogenase